MWKGSSAPMKLFMAPSPANLVNFGASVRDVYRLHFTHQLAAGAVKPMIIPYALLGTFILPILYFSVPHVDRPWLFRARYPLMLFIVVFNTYETLTSSSANFAVGYGVGLCQAWGILWSATLLIWMSPQFEAERVERRRRRRKLVVGAGAAGVSTAMNASAGGHADVDSGRQNGHAPQNGLGLRKPNGRATQNEHPLTDLDGTADASDATQHGKAAGSGLVTNAPDEDIARSLREGYEYYWQAYPANAPFSVRFEWSLDLVSSFRGTGWNWCVPVLPHFDKPEKALCGSLVDLNSIPLCTRQGYRRYTTSREWVRIKLIPMIVGYFALDFLSVIMMKDPYFILGPELAPVAPVAMPRVLASLPAPLLFLYRSLVCFSAVLLAIELIITSYQLLTHLLVRRLLGTRSELWHYPCVYGSFVYGVLDKGMVGFWGVWWHQTFRVAFSAPSAWLGRRGYVDPRSAKGKALAGLIAFAQSGFLHALGSVSCLPPGRPWAPPVFFLLSWVGVFVQTAGCAALQTYGVYSKATTPVWARRAGNLLFAFVWLNATQYFFCDDMSRSGIWLLEPVPVSLFRALGLGRPGDSWWRWDPALWPRWWDGGRAWWQSGIAL